MQFFNLNNPDLYVAIAFSVINGILMCFEGYKFLQILQLSGYKLSGYNAWLKDGSEKKGKYILRIWMLSFLSLICMVVLKLTLENVGDSSYICYVGFIFYFFFAIVYIRNVFIAPKKTPLKTTRRMNRLIILTYALSVVLTFGLFAIGYLFIPYVSWTFAVMASSALPFIIPFVHLIAVPIENHFHYIFIKHAKKKLLKYPNLIKIGITGSYGKTSTKYILNSILSQKYQVCISPNSFNTPMGLTKVVLDYLKPSHDVLIAEMGARNPGDIAYLCDMIKPQYAVITPIGEQHLETFLTLENIKSTKNELVSSIDANGFVVFDGDNQASEDLIKKCTVPYTATSLKNENAEVFASNIALSKSGTSFDLHIGKDSVKCQTKLLGKQNVSNILQATALAFHLGLTLEQISKGINELTPIAHRLELIENNGLSIIDNAYNSSIDGAKCSLDVLALFDGGNKFVITPGLVELGQKEYDANKNFGAQMAKVANYVIIVNDVHQQAIKEGLLQENFCPDNIICAQTLQKAMIEIKVLARSGDVVLFENDLPDNYT